MPMPKATVYENNCSTFFENQIWRARQRTNLKAVPESGVPKFTSDKMFNF